MISNQITASFRDPSGYVFKDGQVIKRVINPVYFNVYDALTVSGFYEKLFNSELLIPHKEVNRTPESIVIKPEQIPFISYPYEWSFNQYKEAALLTLKIQKYCLEHNYSLKDASAFNITFHNGKALFIDTLSFDFYIEKTPWRAYRQFIMHFLAPILLAKYHGAGVLKTVSSFIDGIPLKMVASMLPFKTKLNPFLYSNIHLLAKFEDKYNEYDNSKSIKTVLTKSGQLNIINSLYDFIKKVSLNEHSEWGNYYTKTNYTDSSFKFKSTIISGWVTQLKINTLIDVGGNNGTFVRAISTPINNAIVCDIDNNAVDNNYRTLKKNNEKYILPLVIDVLNASAAIGFNNEERNSFLERVKEFAPDVTLALALIHHISLSGNVPFNMSANFFAAFSKHLIIEFPKRDDSWVERLLNSKTDFKEYFNFYSIENFEKAYSVYFDVIEKKEISGTKRCLFLMKKKQGV